MGEAWGSRGRSGTVWGGRMRFEAAGADVPARFMVDVRGAAPYCRQAQVLVDVIEKKQMRVVAFRPVAEHDAGADSEAGEMYVVLVQCACVHVLSLPVWQWPCICLPFTLTRPLPMHPLHGHTGFS